LKSFHAARMLTADLYRFLRKDKQKLEEELAKNIKVSEKELETLQTTQTYLHKSIEESGRSLQEIIQQFQQNP
jgi:septal ring factor EnvC (AmiA/AmiB activator)